MYNNIGGKIKKLVKIITIGGFIIFGLAGLILAFTTSFIGGILIAVIPCLILWISSFVLYGFGELIDNSVKISQSLKNLENKKTDYKATQKNAPQFFPSKLQPLNTNEQENTFSGSNLK